jgi:hypothetical protein
MPIVLPSGNTAAYLAAIDAAAIYVALPPRIGAATVRGLCRLPREVGDVKWIAWVRTLEDARRIAVPELVWREPNGNGAKTCRSQDELVAVIEQRARDLTVPLTPHERATERAAVLAARVDTLLDDFRRTGQLKAFNACYKAHRFKANGCAKPYHAVFSDLRGVLIRALVEVPRHELSAAVLMTRLHARFPWYTWYG